MKARVKTPEEWLREVSRQVEETKALIIREAAREQALEEVQRKRARRGSEWRKRGTR